ncbi:MAG: hypothetical protein Q9194_004973 [Teloschistes cf. exilis]
MDSQPVAHLLTIDSARVKNEDQEEAAKLFQATKEDGVFYLSLQESSFAEVLSDVDVLLTFAKNFFISSEEEKLQYDIDELGELKLNGLRRYKPVGRNFGGNVFHNMSHIIPAKSTLDPAAIQPPIVAREFPSLKECFIHIRQILLLLLQSLSTSLGLPADVNLTGVHRSHIPSPDIVRLLHYIAQPACETGIPQAAHTDLGSLTMLFATSPGLQILNSRTTEWEYILPKPDCAIINAGDRMAIFLGPLFAMLHRHSLPSA